MEKAIAELLAKQEITELLALYAAAIDRRDGALIERVFTADARLHYGMMDITAQTLVGMLSSDAPPAFIMTHHHVGNVLVQFEDADRAAVVSYVSATHRAVEKGRFRDEMIRPLHRRGRQAGRQVAHPGPPADLRLEPRLHRGRHQLVGSGRRRGGDGGARSARRHLNFPAALRPLIGARGRPWLARFTRS